MDSPCFLFINKDASNVSARNKHELSTVSSWVQTACRKKAKDTRRRQLQTKLLTPFNYNKCAKGANLDGELWQRSSNTFCVGRSAEADARNQCHTKTSEKSYPGANTEQLHVKDQKTTPLTIKKHTSQPTVHERGFSVHVLAPTTVLNPGNSDPFNASVLPIDPHTSSLIAVAFKYHAAVVWVLEAHLGQDSVALTTWWNNLTCSLGHEGLMSSFFGYASALKEQLRWTNSLNVPAEFGATTLSYKTTAIKILRKQLAEDALTLSSLQIVTRLMRLEAYSFNPQAGGSNMQACKMHMQAAKHIVAEFGGLSALPWSQREFLVSADTNLSFILGDKPVFVVEDWDPGPFLGFTTNLRGETGLGCTIQTGVNDLSHLEHVYGLCDESVTAMLTDLRETLAVEDILRSKSQNVRNSPAGYRWLHPRFMACRSQLNTYYIDFVIPLVEDLRSNDPTNHLSQDLTSPRRSLMSACVCIAAMLCERLVFYQNLEMLNRWNTFSSMQHALILCLGSASTEYKDDMTANDDFMLRRGLGVLLWAACILIIMPTMGIKHIEVPYETVRDLLGFLTVSLNLKNLEEVTAVCRTLIWHDRVMTPPLAWVLQEALPNLEVSYCRIG
ncbi:hypothetical protein MMC17_001339 [Xylographa soralifera]|nr:hypothetical protein [Xylographa soralifera]